MQNNDKRKNLKDTILVFTLIILVSLFMIYANDDSNVKVYDCGMAEWHPDIPNAVKEECRKIRREEWQREQQESRKKIIST